MADQNYISPEDFVGKTIPPEILEQLKVLGRVSFTPKPTTVSAVSSAADEAPPPDDVISGLVDHVGSMEDLTSQIEDMIDELTKDMEIPVSPDNSTLTDAVASLSPTGDGSKITQDVMNTALALINHAPILTNGYDPVLAALTGNGTLSGEFMDCNQVNRSIASTWTPAEPNTYTPEQPIKDESAKIADEYEKNLAKIVLEILQTFFFNMLWPKYLVDLAIINPTRMFVAYPTDSIICFFKRMCGKGRFSIKSKDCLLTNGPINKMLNRLRCFMMCVPPAKLWSIKKFKPMVENFDCDCTKYGNPCPPDSRTDGGDESDSKLSGLGRIMDSVFPDTSEPCASPDDLVGKADTSNAEGLGVPPQCLKNAQIVLEAVIADALSPSDPTKVGIAGVQGIGSVITGQTANL